MSLIDSVHGKHVFERRIRVLSEHLAGIIPAGAGSVLDVGCGSGDLAWLLTQRRPELTLTGIDVLVRPDTKISIKEFDGKTIPYADKSVDYVTFVDVLHHTENPVVLLKEAARVARKAVVLKDHLRQGFLAGPTLRFMDWVGNARYGVVLPYNYLSPAEWEQSYAAAGLVKSEERIDLGLYRWWFSWAFGRKLHMVIRLTPR